MKNESLIASGLYGTWTFSTQTMTDIGYYKGRAYAVMHLMPDPMQVRSCQLNDCSEQSNHLCQHNKECVNTEETVVEWSDVTAFFQFGFQLRTGIAFKSYTYVNTSDWIGPYNIVMAPWSRNEHGEDEEILEDGKVTKQLQKFVSRYVTTPASNQIQMPPDATILQPEIFDRMLGTTAINQTIHTQQSLHPRQDPYAAYHETCVKGDIPAGILPQIQLGMLTTTTEDDPSVMDTGYDLDSLLDTSPYTTTKTEISIFRVDFSMLSLPDPQNKLYKLWPSLKKHLGSQFPLQGPYCYGNDPRRGYAIQLSYDSAFDGAKNQSWQVIKGCLPDLPCWSDGGVTPSIPYDNGNSGKYVLDPMGAAALVCYLLGFLLMVSLVFNCQLSNRLKRCQDERMHGEDTREFEPQLHQDFHAISRPVPQEEVFEAFHDLEEPLLAADGCGTDGAEESKVEAD